MLSIEESLISCGVTEISDLSGNPKDHIRRVFNAYDESEDYDFEKERNVHSWHPPFLIFSDIAGGNGDRLAAEIKTQKLGKVIASDVKVNPNSGSKICVWIWQVNYPAVVKYCNPPKVVAVKAVKVKKKTFRC